VSPAEDEYSEREVIELVLHNQSGVQAVRR
jgi:hypothetical protein